MLRINNQSFTRWIFFEILQFIRFIVFGFPAATASFMLLGGTFAGVMFFLDEKNPQALECFGQFFSFIESVFHVSIPDKFTDEDLFKVYLSVTTILFLFLEVLKPFFPEKFKLSFRKRMTIHLLVGLVLIVVNVLLFSFAFSDEDILRLASFLSFFFLIVLFASLFYSIASYYSGKGIEWLDDNWR